MLFPQHPASPLLADGHSPPPADLLFDCYYIRALAEGNGSSPLGLPLRFVIDDTVIQTAQGCLAEPVAVAIVGEAK